MFKKIKLKNQKTEKELFVENLETMFSAAYDELEELNLTFRAIILDNDDMRSTFTNTIKQLDKIRSNLFRNCCLTTNKELFDITFCFYRDFLVKYDKMMSDADVICSTTFKETKDISLEIIALKKKLNAITNDNIAEHSKIHQHNEPYLQQIEQLQKKREEILMQPSKQNEHLFA